MRSGLVLCDGPGCSASADGPADLLRHEWLHLIEWRDCGEDHDFCSLACLSAYAAQAMDEHAHR
jgi:hypothetical protein